MTDSSSPPLDYFESQEDRLIGDMIELLEIESISTDSNYLGEVRRAAEWTATYLDRLGMEDIRILPTAQGHPVVSATNNNAGADAPTMLVYGHYDVQPADPIDLWETPPFSPEIRGDRIYGRGTSDMKGQLMAVLFAIEAATKTVGMPLNIRFLLEGQEEIGSRNIGQVIEENQALFEADFSLNPDAGMWALDQPAITYGLRGLIDFELRIFGPKRDLHSGLFGGVLHNPAQALAEVIAGMHDEQGVVTLEGFYDNVRMLPEEEREKLKLLGRDEDYILRASGSPRLWGEPGYTPMERIGARPTLEVNGLSSGYSGEGMKTIIPSTAMAKISLRLVPNQDPEEVRRQMDAYLQANIPDTVRWELIQFSQGYPSITNLNSYYVSGMVEALTRAWGVQPVFPLGGGSIPVVAILQHQMGIESILTGYNLPEDQIHSPNESMHLPTWRKGIRSLIYFFDKFRNNSMV
jgi:acetylornithine deacetylase/succinyl-diaminopimelate desuccinylase-like protein